MQQVEATLSDLDRRGVTGRIWRRDHTLWKPQPEEIADRLGWLDVTQFARQRLDAINDFAQEVMDLAFRHVVLLGMGGSSLGPEVLRATFGSAAGYPELIVLDSAIPSRVREVTEDIDPTRTLFLVSSKSGSTVEPNALYRYFRGVVEREVGSGQAAGRFVAITDPGTPLEELALAEGFRRTFLNPSDIGGRYSVLSHFGLVPGALMGVDLEGLLNRADLMREACASDVPAADNPGARLGATMGTLALSGRDKLTLFTSPSISSFGLWVEQLIAESTGKEGRGIVPVAGEPVPVPASYGGEDRLFVYMRLEGDDNATLDSAVADVESLGHPLVRLELGDRYDLGAEFFRWEFATAVAGSILGINPFDQPDVEGAKQQTEWALKEHQKSGHLPEVEAKSFVTAIQGLLGGARRGDYLAVTPFLHQAPEVDQAMAVLRRRVVDRHNTATTLGYGPRYLHSTGQLHKGGPDSGLFLQFTADHADDVPIPGEPYTFGVLADAQALGDFRALQERRRRVVRVRFGPESAREIAHGW